MKDTVVRIRLRCILVKKLIFILQAGPSWMMLARDVNVFFLLLLANSSFFIASLKKKFVSFRFCLKYKNKKNVSKYFDIEKAFFKTFNQFFFVFRFSFFVFVWERFVSSKQNLPNTTNLILLNWLNSMVVQLDISRENWLS